MVRSHLAAGLLGSLMIGLLLSGCINTTAQSTVHPKQVVEPLKGFPACGDPPAKELTPRPLDRIKAGTVIGDKPPEGWTHIVEIAMPRLGKGDVEKASADVKSFTNMFWPTILANVKKQGDTYVLDKVGVNYALPVNDERVIATSKEPSGAALGLLGPAVLRANEKFLDQAREPAYTATMQVFDIPGILLRNDEHEPVSFRHAVLVDPTRGDLAWAVWVMEKEGEDRYPLIGDTLQVLPANFREDRVLNVKGDRFGLLGIPSPDAFGQVQVAQGRAVKFTPALRSTAGLKTFSTKTAAELEAGLHAAIGDKWPGPK